MMKAARYLLLPLLLANITVAANLWSVFGVNQGEVLFWIIIGLSMFIVWDSPYRSLGASALGVSLSLRLAEYLTGSATVETLRHASLAVLFVTAGARAYGRNPRLLHRQLVIFLALCIPIMLLQMSGAHSLFMTWDIDYAHDTSILSLDEIGTFKQIQVYPTLFVNEYDVIYQIGQGRPSGLLYANNVLSVFVVITAGLSIAMARRSRLRLADVIVSASLVLVMSLTAYLSALLMYAAVFVFGRSSRKRHVLKVVALVGVFGWLYYFLFPGLFERNLSDAKFMGSLYSRGLELFDMAGLPFLRQMYERDSWYLGDMVHAESTYSGIAKMLKSPIGGALIILVPLCVAWYVRRLWALRRTRGLSSIAYGVTAFACLLTQFGVPYFEAPSFQFILGFAMFPAFARLWPRKSVSPALGPPGAAAPSIS